MNENEVGYWMLNPPERLESVERWEDWLDSLRELPKGYPEVEQAIADAERWIPKRIELEPQIQHTKKLIKTRMADQEEDEEQGA
jgi:hypothetical protein